MREHVRFMDGLRGIAVLMVLLYHGNEQGLLSTSVTLPGFSFEFPFPLMRAGAIGVEIFFFISGFALMYPVARHVFEGLPRVGLREYARRRALKILPSYVVALVVLTAIEPLDVPDGEPLLRHFAMHLFFLHGLTPATFVSIVGPLWTLAIELQFYVLFPLIAFAFVRRPKTTLAAMIAVSVAYRIVMDVTVGGHDFFLTNQLPDFLDLFGFGMFASWTVVRRHGRVRSAAETRRWTLAAVVATVLFYGMLGAVLQTGGPDSWKWQNDHRDLEALLLFVFALGTAFGAEAWRALFTNRVLLFFSTISYNLYLWNKNVLVWFNQHWAAVIVPQAEPGALGAVGNAIPMAIVLAFPILVATAATYVIERPILAGGAKSISLAFARAMSRVPAPRVATSTGSIEAGGAGPPRGRATLLASLTAFVLPLALYVASVHHLPTGAYGDELVTVAYVMGVAAPPVYPAYAGFGWLFAHALAAGYVAWRVVLLSAFSTAVAAWFVARAVRVLGGEAWIGTGCALAFASGSIVWTDATDACIAPLALAFAAASLTALARYATTGSWVAIAIAGCCAGLGASAHPIVLFIVPGIALTMIARLPADRLRSAGALVACGAAIATGLSPYLALSLRARAIAASGADPLRSLAGSAAAAVWTYEDPTSFASVARAFSDVPALLEHVTRLAQTIGGEVGMLTAVVAFAGVVLLVRRVWPLGCAFLAAGTLPALAELGLPSTPAGLGFETFALWTGAVFLGIGSIAFVRLFSEERQRARRATVLGIIVAGSLGNVFAHQNAFENPSVPPPDPVVVSVGQVTPSNAIVIAAWDKAMPLAESAYAEHFLGTRTIDSSVLGDDVPELATWSKTRPVYAIGVPRDFRASHVRLKLLAGKAGDPSSVSAVTWTP